MPSRSIQSEPIVHDNLVQYLVDTYKVSPEQATDLLRKYQDYVKANSDLVDANPNILDAVARKEGWAKTQTDAQKTQQASQQTSAAVKQAQDVASAVRAGNLSPEAGKSAIEQALASISGGLGANAPAQVLQLLGGRNPTPEEIKSAIATYNASHPDRPIANNDAQDLYARVVYDPSARIALGSATEGPGTSYTTFNVFDPASMGFRQVSIQSRYLDGVIQEIPDAASYVHKAIAASARVGDDVPFQILLAGTRLVGGIQRFKARGEATEYVDAAGRRKQGGDRNNLDDMAVQLRDLVKRYGDYGLALVAVRNPSLADAIYEQGGVAADQSREVSQILLDAGYDPQSMAKQGLAIDPVKFAALADTSGAAGRPRVEVIEDPARLREGVRGLLRAWFNREATDEELSQYGGMIHSLMADAARAKSNSGQGNVFKGVPAAPNSVVTVDNVDAQSRLMESLRATPEYQALFGKKPEGMSEEDWANQFRSTQQSLFGSQVDPNAVRAGMESGQTQTTVGYLAGTAAARDNSSFQQRLAIAANVIGRMT